MHSDHVGTFIKQRLSRVTFDDWVEPRAGPDYFYLSAWVYGLDTKGEGVNSSYNFWDWESSDIADQT